MKRSTTTKSPNEKTIEILRGRDGQDGLPRPPGPKGDTGVPGPKGKRVGGVMYVHWGHNSCPDSGAETSVCR